MKNLFCQVMLFFDERAGSRTRSIVSDGGGEAKPLWGTYTGVNLTKNARAHMALNAEIDRNVLPLEAAPPSNLYPRISPLRNR